MLNRVPDKAIGTGLAVIEMCLERLVLQVEGKTIPDDILNAALNPL